MFCCLRQSSLSREQEACREDLKTARSDPEAPMDALCAMGKGVWLMVRRAPSVSGRVCCRNPPREAQPSRTLWKHDSDGSILQSSSFYGLEDVAYLSVVRRWDQQSYRLMVRHVLLLKLHYLGAGLLRISLFTYHHCAPRCCAKFHWQLAAKCCLLFSRSVALRVHAKC